MKFYINQLNIDEIEFDCIIVGIFKENNLSHSASLLDKLSHGYITKLIQSGDIKGEIGQTLLLYNFNNVFDKKVLLVGCGKKENSDLKDINKILKNSMSVLLNKPVKKILCCLSELYITNYKNVYWVIRSIVRNIMKSFYQICKITNISKNDRNVSEILLHILDTKDVSSAKIALTHALAIDKSITITKDLSNLPPNVCNPLYLSQKSKLLTKKYKNSIQVEIINMEKMISLGMNAYVSVGKGSKNKPYMSVIKYSHQSSIKNKVIGLVGKGVTFDSGGISIKPSRFMHEMKYDMCGAAAIYGTIIMAARLKLPLTIIGIIASCENMPDGNSLRPGDILTTMSGKTVEVLNTDAEGRLVLCDALTYLERFSPDIVIDIATLTGACVVALGDSVSGLFSNNEDLAKKLIHASKQTNDKIWRLPLFKHYEKELSSNFADLANIGKGKAGAISAAIFLSFFTKKYHWAHIDIAGTAWKKDYGATGRPVELLCQFLLNESKANNNNI